MSPAKNPPQDASADDVQSADVDPRIAELEAQVMELTEQLKKLTDLAARSQADLQNAKVRMVKDGDELRKFAAESVLQKLLPTIDNFQRAFQHLPEDLQKHEWVKGVFAIEEDLLRQVTAMGLKKMDVMGQMADTAKHEVLMTGPGTEGIVTEVFENGYELNGRVIRPAKVKVGDGSAANK